MATRTYICGGSGIVRRLDNLSGAWVSIAPGPPITFRDVKTDPNVSEKVFLVGEANYIYVSANAGNTWGVPGGTHGSLTTSYFEVWPVSSSVIYAVGSSGHVIKSIDSGATFNPTVTFPTPSGLEEQGDSKAVHFIDADIGIVSFEKSIYKTINGGITWTRLNGGADIFPLLTTSINGIHLSADEQVIVAVTDAEIIRSTDGGTTFTSVYTFSLNSGLHLTWLNDSTLWATGAGTQRLQSINGGATWTVLSPIVTPGALCHAAHFYNTTNGFYTLNGSAMQSSDAGLTGILSLSLVTRFLAVWTRFAPVSICYLLQDCNGLYSSITTTQDLSAYVGSTVTLVGYNTCWTVVVNPDPNARCSNVPVTIVDIFQDCSQCNSPCYQLTDCDNDENILITDTNLSAYVGDVIKVVECPGTCWQVATSTDCEEVTPVTVTATYGSCLACAPEEEVEEEQLPRRDYIPGMLPFNCSPERIKEINCNFANEIYKVVKKLRYGVSSCCDGDYEDAVIAKSLLDLQLLKDEDACKPVEAPACCAICNLTSTLIVFNTVR